MYEDGGAPWLEEADDSPEASTLQYPGWRRRRFRPPFYPPYYYKPPYYKPPYYKPPYYKPPYYKPPYPPPWGKYW